LFFVIKIELEFKIFFTKYSRRKIGFDTTWVPNSRMCAKFFLNYADNDFIKLKFK